MTERLSDYTKILSDTDGLTADTSKTALALTKRFIRMYRINPKLNFESEDVNCWEFVQNKLIENGFDKNKARQLADRIWTSRYVLKYAPPVPGAVELIRHLYDEGHDVIPHTSRLMIDGIKEITEEWIDKKLIFTEEALTNPTDSGLRGVEFKANNAIELAEKYGSVLVLDDFPGHVIEMINHIKKHIKRTGKALNIHFVLIPYAKISIPDQLIGHPMVTVVYRDSNGSIQTLTNRMKYENALSHNN